ncbi:YadA-like family protein [Sphingomonas sp. CJ99]
MALATGASIWGAEAVAQTVPTTITDDPQTVSIYETSCAGGFFANPGQTCTFDGDSRTVTTVTETRTTTPSGNTRIQNGVYDVDIVNWNVNRTVNLGGTSNRNITARTSLQYTGQFNDFLFVGAVPPGSEFAAFPTYLNRNLQLDFLDVSGREQLDGFAYTYRTVDGSQIINNNATRIVGRFYDTNTNDGLSFGTVTGLATLGAAPVSRVGPVQSDLADLSFVTTTHLDETGLITPRITVSQGIDMSGSRITNLAAGIAATDAVNVGQLQQETAARTAADTALAGAIAAEATTRANADTQLAAAITSEATARANADTQLAGAIANEATTRANADTALAGAIASESATRASADTQLAGAIVSESTARANALLQVSQRIQTLESVDNSLASALANENAARIAADNALSLRVDAVASRLDQIDSRLDRMDASVASAGAIATAMGGAVFLPDMKFNLTANVATYDGAHAGSMQLGAMVTRNVAVNVGAATGFNRGGKTAARAGMTIGW